MSEIACSMSLAKVLSFGRRAKTNPSPRTTAKETPIAIRISFLCCCQKEALPSNDVYAGIGANKELLGGVVGQAYPQ